MDNHAKEYFRQFSEKAPGSSFHKVIALHDAPDSTSWTDLTRKIPILPRGWYELSEMPSQDRIDFVRDYWLSKLPFCPHIIERLDPFFENLDDIGVFIFQEKFDDPWRAEMVYSIKDNGGFFRGGPPASEEQLYNLQKLFPETILPEDYTAFLSIHNGFSKANDTGIIATDDFQTCYKEYESTFEGDRIIQNAKGEAVNPKSLIPFYVSFGMPFYQCFWADWYPESEMGNVYYSGVTNQISNVKCSNPESDQMAFRTFNDWLFFYIETLT